MSFFFLDSFLIRASRLRAADSDAIFFFQMSVAGRWLRVYAAPTPSLCRFKRASTSIEMPVYKLPSEHRRMYTYHVDIVALPKTGD
jgi:hypothetical protein